MKTLVLSIAVFGFLLLLSLFSVVKSVIDSRRSQKDLDSYIKEDREWRSEVLSCIKDIRDKISELSQTSK